ncbi:MAG: DUF433 domain-containing protein [Candidatus Lokiarchaeota archaeon]|nr:DUF433 domain-containing protein [Candidatus Lokiarchaeota archaeon]
MSKYENIIRDPEICGGAPVIKGTRVLVMDILDWIKEGKTFEEILENYPTISREDIREIISYAQDIIAGEIVIYGSNEHQVST